MLDRAKHPFVLLKAVDQILDKFVELEERYGLFVKEAVPSERDDKPIKSIGFTPYHLAYLSTAYPSDFYFELRGVRMNASTPEYWVVFAPKNDAAATEFGGFGTLSTTIDRFDKWVKLLQDYATIKLDKKSRFAENDAQEFYDYFELVEEDSTTAPFEEEQQLYLYRLLEHIKHEIELDDNADSPEAQSIVQDILLLETRIPTVTKAVAIKGLSKIYAKVKVFSFKLFADSVDVIKKEAIKAVLYGGIHKIEKAIHVLQHLHDIP
jgi:hypothetical protein